MSQTATPPVADDIAYVLGLPADRQSAVLSALVKHLTGDRAGAAIPIAADGHQVGTYLPALNAADFRTLVDALTPAMPPISHRSLPPNLDPTDPDNWATDEELDALTAQVRGRGRSR